MTCNGARHGRSKNPQRNRWFDFQCLALQLAKQRWPDLEPTQWWHDGGEDGITVPSQGADGLKRSLACSLSGTLEKVRGDCKRIAERGVDIDILVFYTPVVVTNLEITAWQEKIRQEFRHALYVMPRAAVIAALESPQNAWLCREYLELAFADEPDLESLAARGRSVAAKSLLRWKEEFGYEPDKQIQLTLRLESEKQDQKGTFLNLEEVCKTACRVRGLILKGPPGAGKTITLLQIATVFAEAPRGPIPIVISLPEWGAKDQDFLSFLAEEPLYQSAGLSKTDWLRLNQAGRVIFLLNGWNEISTQVLEKAFYSLRALVKSSPATAFVIGTRESAVTPPLTKPVIVQVEPLEPQQRRDVIAAAQLSNPAAIVDAIEHQPAIEQMTRTPLFLTGVIELARQGSTIPASRYGIIKALVEKTEVHPDHSAELINGPSGGYHRHYLSHMASSMCRAGSTNLPEEQALRAIAECSKILREKRCIGDVPNAHALLESLVAHHLLVKSAYSGKDSIRFVHQQFQEWFAVEWVYERLVETVESPEDGAVFRFQRDILNNLAWEESLKFLAERLNPMHGWEEEARHADAWVRLTMPVDLIFAAELARLVGWNTLIAARTELNSALRTWYARSEEPHKECALAAMLATGSADFQDIFMPLIESDNQQVRLRFYRAWKPFPLSWLGTELSQRLADWSEERRAEFIHEIMWKADTPHHQLAVRLAQEDPSPRVRTTALEALAWNGAFETVITILESGSHTWPVEISYRLLEWIPRRYLPRLAPRIKAILPTMAAPEARCTFLRLLEEASDHDAIMLIKKELDHDPPSQTVSELLTHLHARDPEWVAEWLGKRMIHGDFWEEQWTEYLSGASPEVLASLGKAVSGTDLDLNTLARRLRVLSKVAPHVTAKSLLLEFLEKRAERIRLRAPKSGWCREDVLSTALAELPYPAIVHATLEIEDRLRDSYRVQAILEILVHHSALSDRDVRSILSPEECDRFRALIFTWDKRVPLLEHDLGSRGAYLATLLGAIGKPEDTAVLERWTQDDLARERETPRTMRIRWTNCYAKALAKLNCAEADAVLLRLLSDPIYVGDASRELSYLARNRGEAVEARISFGPDYRDVWRARQEREARSGNSQADARRVEHAGAIREALTTRLDERQESGESSTFPPFDLEQAAVALAHLGEEDCIPLLLRCRSYEALQVLILKGIKLPGAETLAVLDPIITKIENEPSYSNPDHWYVAERCLSVLLFSDNPALGVERIRHTLPRMLNSYHAKNLIQVLGLCRASEAAEFLTELIGNRDVLRHCMWEYINALAESRQPQGRRALLRLLDKLGDSPDLVGNGRFDAIRGLGEALARVAEEDDEMWSEIKRRCEGSLNTSQREALVWTLEKLDTDEAALAACLLLRDEPRFHIGQLSMHIIENALFYRVQAETANSYYLQPKPANAFRMRLMEQALHNPTCHRSSLASLAEIETRRRDIGKPPDEPRHPDIASLTAINMPWPLLHAE